MSRRAFFVFVAVFAMFFAVPVPAQTQYKLQKVLGTHDVAPVPAQLSQIVEYWFNDKGEVAYIADNGVLFRSGQKTRIIAAAGMDAPGGGYFLSGEGVFLNDAEQILFHGEVSYPGSPSQPCANHN